MVKRPWQKRMQFVLGQTLTEQEVRIVIRIIQGVLKSERRSIKTALSTIANREHNEGMKLAIKEIL